VCGEGFLNGQLTVTRGLGDFHPEMRDTHELRERLKYAASGQGAGGALRLVGPLTSGAPHCSRAPAGGYGARSEGHGARSVPGEHAWPAGPCTSCGVASKTHGCTWCRH